MSNCDLCNKEINGDYIKATTEIESSAGIKIISLKYHVHCYIERLEKQVKRL
jgi:hypothetical protein